MVNNDTYWLIFMEIRRPDVDGIQVTKHVREMELKSSIVPLTVYDHESNRDACWQAGVDDIMSKPVKRKTLRDSPQKFAKDDGDGEAEKEKGKNWDESRDSCPLARRERSKRGSSGMKQQVKFENDLVLPQWVCTR